MTRRFTQEMIREEFIRMLNESPLDKITVTELVERCQINRKTFYYYYQDLYAILDEIFAAELERVLHENGDGRTWEESFLAATRFARENCRAINHVYHSLRREELEQYLYNVSGQVMGRYVAAMNREIGASESDQALITVFYQSALTEMVMRWVACGMKDDPERAILRMGKLLGGNIVQALQRSRALPEE